jgi:hypothetical protein
MTHHNTALASKTGSRSSKVLFDLEFIQKTTILKFRKVTYHRSILAQHTL